MMPMDTTEPTITGAWVPHYKKYRPLFSTQILPPETSAHPYGTTKRLKLTDKSIDGNVVLSTVNLKAELTSRLSSYNRTGGKTKKKRFKKGRRASAKPGSAGF